ncbi:unnamed protein product [Pieris macdunnoughi]|uniref:Receptor ligand binding region domain-containing protein n=1 Tax=Pieris macdunnoughi TaxID=345717 RepID=A0A821TWE9_9NEOP|nr:unnamed protein product [Pieris macdunnoughi]
MNWRAVLVLLSIVGGVISQNCRGEELKPRACENVCDENGQCKIRAALLLPKNTTFYASLPVVEPVLDLAVQSQAIRNAFPPWLSFEWTTYDVTDCDAAYAVISAIDAYNDCAHVFFGPACDFALADDLIYPLFAFDPPYNLSQISDTGVVLICVIIRETGIAHILNKMESDTD